MSKPTSSDGAGRERSVGLDASASAAGALKGSPRHVPFARRPDLELASVCAKAATSREQLQVLIALRARLKAEDGSGS